ncbi:hypothetical protein N7466_000660 [Penicillium verhagenii]|uniref:uncharacterized protein n=1 Tax=Penicillium verhagenii TaxID=1562060 RepID=UPI0025453CAC|nr:uncharacterized protein N7466_000660 [Penicillium verhagenii]KAJ5947645.1 hypothetical protein N7466_000660 [Penicillium verhagenii]
MGFFDHAERSHEEVYEQGQQYHHEAKFSHEAIAGAASFAGMKAWEDHQRAQGKTVKHAFAKEALMGLVGAEVDKLVETKGLDAIDRQKLHHESKKHAEAMYDEQYNRHGGDEWHPHYEPHQSFERRERFERQW